MTTILHLSDLHLFASRREQEIIFDELVSALQHVREHAASPIGLLAITATCSTARRSTWTWPRIATECSAACCAR